MLGFILNAQPFILLIGIIPLIPKYFRKFEGHFATKQL